MLQIVQGRAVYVVDLKTLPALPVVGTGYEQYYAEALTRALLDGVVTEPGKYGIELYYEKGIQKYNIYLIID